MLTHLRVPFSAPGSLLGVSTEMRKDPEQFFLRTLHRFADPRDLYAIHLGTLAGKAKGTPELRPEVFTLAAGSTRLEVTFADADTVRFRVRGGSVRFAQAAGVSETLADGANAFTTQVLSLQLGFRFALLSGSWKHGHGGATGHPDRLWLELHPDAKTGVAELVVQELVAGRTLDASAAYADFDAVVMRRSAEFSTYRAKFAATAPHADATALTEAAYIFWSSEVAPRGPLKRRAVWMTKNWMTAIWSWDNCFNARALAAVDPELAWDQFMFFFDHQTPGGRSPDLVTAFYTQWGMVKPPVYGWTLRHLRKHAWFNDVARLTEAYAPMAQQTRFWFQHRDSDGDGLPEYSNGCDSGWDNATAFDKCVPAASPDLVAWLVIQLEELADIAPRVGRPADVATWRALADKVVAANATHAWNGRSWSAAKAGTHERSPVGDSLLPHLVGLMGHRLDIAQRASVVAALGDEKRFLAPAGVASESLASPLYEDDGYWRGPVWGASNVVAAEAAAACGDPKLAAEIARRFAATCVRSGFAENFNAKTFVGLRDPGYTWTAACWLIVQQDWL